MSKFKARCVRTNPKTQEAIVGKNMYGKGGKPKPQTKKQKAAKKAATAKKKAEGSLEQMSFRERQLLAHKRVDVMRPLEERFAQAKKDLDAGYKVGDELGAPKKTVKLLMVLKEKDDSDKRQKALSRIRSEQELVKMANLQGELFVAEPLSREDTIYENGRTAAYSNEPRKFPDYLNDLDGQIWMQGHEAGTAHMNRERAAKVEAGGETGFKLVGDAVPSTIKEAA